MATGPAAPLGSTSAERSFLVAWWIWMLACVATLAAFALRIQLVAQPPEPLEDGAFVAVGVVALILGCWMGPALLRDRWATWTCCAAIVPILLIANLIGHYAAGHAVGGIALICLWLLALHAALKWPIVGRTIAALAVLGPVLLYLSQEFAPTPFHAGHWLAVVSPILGAIAIFPHRDSTWLPFWPPAALLGTALLQYGVRTRPWRRRGS